MNVKELIRELTKHNPDLVVVTVNDEWGVLDPVLECRLTKATKLKKGIGIGYVAEPDGELTILQLC